MDAAYWFEDANRLRSLLLKITYEDICEDSKYIATISTEKQRQESSLPASSLKLP